MIACMLYQLRITTSEGNACVLATKFASVDAAMTTARIALRHGAKDARIDDENGNTVADVDLIQARRSDAVRKKRAGRR
jgi:hypothetical protein